MGENKKDLTPYLMEKKFCCPVCDIDFKNWSVRKSKIRLLGSGTDLRPNYTPIDPMYYDVAICPRCGYSGMANSFSKIRTAQIVNILKEITPKYVPKQYPMVYTTGIAIERYKIALLSTLSKQGKSSEKAYICLKIAWLYRDMEDEEQEKKFLNFSLNNFEEAFQKENMPFFNMDEPTLMYLMGDLSRRIGDNTKALKYISQVIVSSDGRLKDRAIDLKNLIKDDLKN